MRALYNIFCLILSMFVSGLSSGQELRNPEDIVILRLEGLQFGTIQWQESVDSINWVDITGAVGNNFQIMHKPSFYYRAKVSSGTCDPLFSEIIKIGKIEFKCGDSFFDSRNGEKYPTVLIGSQCWFAKNLNIGVVINNGTQTPSDNGIIEKYCYNNDSNKCKTYGGLYDWNEMMIYSTVESSQGICPDGWHIPSDQEWKQMEVALGMDSSVAALGNTWRGTDQGTKLKSGGSSGYNALLSGSAIPGGYFNQLDNYEYMFTSTSADSYAWRRCVRKDDATVGRWNTFLKTYGLSVRCVKN